MFEGGNHGISIAGRVEIFSDPYLQDRRTVWIRCPDELDRAPSELQRASRVADQSGEVRGPGVEVGEVEPGKLRRARHLGPQREDSLEMRVGLGEPKDSLGLPRRL